MKRALLIAWLALIVALLGPAAPAMAGGCTEQDDAGCAAQRVCQYLADRTHLVSCIQ